MSAWATLVIFAHTLRNPLKLLLASVTARPHRGATSVYCYFIITETKLGGELFGMGKCPAAELPGGKCPGFLNNTALSQSSLRYFWNWGSMKLKNNIRKTFPQKVCLHAQKEDSYIRRRSNIFRKRRNLNMITCKNGAFTTLHQGIS
jgi:hypothetical protein